MSISTSASHSQTRDTYAVFCRYVSMPDHSHNHASLRVAMLPHPPSKRLQLLSVHKFVRAMSGEQPIGTASDQPLANGSVDRGNQNFKGAAIIEQQAKVGARSRITGSLQRVCDGITMSQTR